MKPDIELYCRNKYGKEVLVGAFLFNPGLGEYRFLKNKPRLMGKIGAQGGYGIQKNVMAHQRGARKSKRNLLEIFKAHPETQVYIRDMDLGRVYISQAKDWVEHSITADYGNGSQLFLGIEYMKLIEQGGEKI